MDEDPPEDADQPKIEVWGSIRIVGLTASARLISGHLGGLDGRKFYEVCIGYLLRETAIRQVISARSASYRGHYWRKVLNREGADFTVSDLHPPAFFASSQKPLCNPGGPN